MYKYESNILLVEGKYLQCVPTDHWVKVASFSYRWSCDQICIKARFLISLGSQTLYSANPPSLFLTWWLSVSYVFVHINNTDTLCILVHFLYLFYQWLTLTHQLGCGSVNASRSLLLCCIIFTNVLFFHPCALLRFPGILSHPSYFDFCHPFSHEVNVVGTLLMLSAVMHFDYRCWGHF